MLNAKGRVKWQVETEKKFCMMVLTLEEGTFAEGSMECESFDVIECVGKVRPTRLRNCQQRFEEYKKKR